MRVSMICLFSYHDFLFFLRHFPPSTLFFLCYLDLACQAQWPFATGLGSILSLDPENERQAEKVGEREREAVQGLLSLLFSLVARFS